MPITLPSGAATELAKRGGWSPRLVADIITADGSNYFLGQYASTLPARITSGNQAYLPWIKSAGPITQAKDGSTDGGDLTIENLSGNTIERDDAKALATHEFEGALIVLRVWHPLLQVALKEFHFTLHESTSKEDEATFRMLQLADFSRIYVGDAVIQETCSFAFKTLQCGSTGTATSCPKRLVDCQDPTRAAQERFDGVIVTLSNKIASPLLSGGGGGRDDGGGGDPGDRGGGIGALRS